MRELPPRCKAVAEYYLANPNLKHRDLAQYFKLSESRISAVLRHPAVIEHFPVLARRVIQRRFLPKAMKAYDELLDQSANLQVREKAAHTVLKETRVFDAPELTIKHEISSRPLAELQAIVEQSLNTPSGAIEAELIDEKEETQS